MTNSFNSHLGTLRTNRTMTSADYNEWQQRTYQYWEEKSHQSLPLHKGSPLAQPLQLPSAWCSWKPHESICFLWDHIWQKDKYQKFSEALTSSKRQEDWPSLQIKIPINGAVLTSSPAHLHLLRDPLLPVPHILFIFFNKNVPFHNVETWDTILATHSIEVAPKNCYSNTGPAGACGGHITAPLIGFRIIPRKTHQTPQITCLGRLQILSCLGETPKQQNSLILSLNSNTATCKLHKTPEVI